MNIPAPIQKVIEKAEALKAEVKSVGIESFKEMLRDFFEKHPNVVSIRWAQYTPHFNDGDPCVFSVNEPEVEVLAGTLLAKKDPQRGWPEEDQFAQEGEYNDGWTFRTELPQLNDSVQEIYRVFQDIEDVMLAVFGDGVQVTVSREGEIEIDDYDHD